MIKVTPFIATLGTERYKELLSSPFDFSMLETHFTGWKEIVEDYYTKYSCENVVISILPTEYEIARLNGVIKFPLPETINDFINDIRRVGVALYWGTWIEENYEPKDFLPQNEIETYYKELLTSIDKGHELLTEKGEGENEAKP